MKYVVTIDAKEFEVDIQDAGDELSVAVDGKSLATSIESGANNHQFLMLLDAKSYDTEVFKSDDGVAVFLHGREFDCTVEDQRLVAIRKAAGIKLETGRKELYAPMPGLVMRILKSAGDKVKKGEPLLVVEAMKMENELKSPTDGVIREVHAVVGKPIDKGAVLVSFEG
ncbi:MAG: acetyl-CoA carboxylase biotin carboxyl carrier protein subunit [bacterium]|nr:acetyl-CoA carboxylase biotin carboxyl carrier protein subunit [bacterium]